MSKYTLLVGNYGASNIGDELLHFAARKKLATQSLPIKTMSPIGGVFPVFPAGFRSILNLGQWQQACTGLLGCKQVVYGGGGLINSQNKRSYWIWLQILFWAVLFRKPVSMWGQSFSSKPGFFLRLLLSKVQLIELRDQLSYEFLDNLGLKIKKADDLALCLSKQEISSIFEKFQLKDVDALEDIVTSGYTLVNLRHYKVLKPAKLESVVKNILSSHRNLVFCAFEQSDVDFHKQYFANTNVKCLSPSAKLFENAKQAIGMRLHFLICAQKFGLNIQILAYAPKVLGFFSDQGLSDIKILYK